MYQHSRTRASTRGCNHDPGRSGAWLCCCIGVSRTRASPGRTQCADPKRPRGPAVALRATFSPGWGLEHAPCHARRL
eukprot:9396241-Pyramimonas_sp.AAC.1